MLSTKDLFDKFETLQEYEQFCLEWTYVCAELNPIEQNFRRLQEALCRAERLGIKKQI